MLRSYLIVTLRSLARQKGYTAINIVGLALGVAASLLILLLVRHELSYDRFHEHAEDLYRATMHLEMGDRVNDIAVTMPPLAPQGAERIPEIEDWTRLVNSDGGAWLEIGPERHLLQEVVRADGGFFSLFTFPLLEGDPGSALERPGSVVLTRPAARRIYGDRSALGERVVIEGEEYTVTGVAEAVPAASHLQFDAVLRHEAPPAAEASWGMIMYRTYFRLASGADPSAVEEKLQTLFDENFGNSLREMGNEALLHLQPVLDIHMHSNLAGDPASNTSPAYVYGFAAIAGFILLLACINFVNLATARSARRAREVGVRKVMGAQRRQLVAQYLGESFLVALAALLVALLLVILALPSFGALAGRELEASLLGDPWVVAGLVGILLLAGLGSGAFPAFALARYRPAEVMKGSMKRGTRGRLLRQLLVVGQFVVSIALLISTLTAARQIHHLKTHRLGFDKEQVVVLDLPGRQLDPAFPAEALKQAMLEQPGIEAASLSASIPFGGNREKTMVVAEGMGEDEYFETYVFKGDHDFVAAYGIEVLRGRDFDAAISTDATTAVLLNETAVADLGWEQPLGKAIPLRRGDPGLDGEGRAQAPAETDCQVVGIISDFHYNPLTERIEPLVMYVDERQTSALSVRLAAGIGEAGLERMEAAWQRVVGDAYPFEPVFLSRRTRQLLKAEERFAGLVTGFTVLAVGIALLGLFGLASSTAEQRTKEIGVRKVLGASAGSVVALLTGQFTRPVLLGAVIASPLAWWAMQHWLRDYPYRISMGWELFVGAAALALAAAWLAVAGQALRAARTNPVKALRYE